MPMIVITSEALTALKNFNAPRGIAPVRKLSNDRYQIEVDNEVLERLNSIAFPNESTSDVIIRACVTNKGLN